MKRYTAVLIVLALCGIAAGELYASEDYWFYSNDPDERIEDIINFIHDGWSPQQVIRTLPPDHIGAPLPGNAMNFGKDIDVDALASGYDLGDTLHSIIMNAANLLLSFQGDPRDVVVFGEYTDGSIAYVWQQWHFCCPPYGMDNGLDDADGIEWPSGPQYYSETGDADGISVRTAGGGVYLTHAQIASACLYLDYEGPEALIDLDALMVLDGNEPGQWDQKDIVVFSVRDTRPVGNFDGGELIVLRFPASAEFLDHGGHVWNTKYRPDLAFDIDTEEIDGLEQSPRPTGIGSIPYPDRFELEQNHPNPFNPTTTIRFVLPHAARVRLCVYNIRGELVATLVDRRMTEGRKEVVWEAKDNGGRTVSSSIYFYRLVAGEFVQTKKMVLLR